MTGQLSLFKSKRQRGVALLAAEGIRLALCGRRHREALDFAGLDLDAFSGRRASHGDHRRAAKAHGLNRGFPDFQFFHRGGRVCFLELKRQGNSLDENQAEIAAHLKDAGHDYVVTDQFEVAIQRWWSGEF